MISTTSTLIERAKQRPKMGDPNYPYPDYPDYDSDPEYTYSTEEEEEEALIKIEGKQISPESEKEWRDMCKHFVMLTLALLASLTLMVLTTYYTNSGVGTPDIKMKMHTVNSSPTINATIEYLAARLATIVADPNSESAFRSALEALLSVPTEYRISQYGYCKKVRGSDTKCWNPPVSLNIPLTLLLELLTVPGIQTTNASDLRNRVIDAFFTGYHESFGDLGKSAGRLLTHVIFAGETESLLDQAPSIQGLVLFIAVGIWVYMTATGPQKPNSYIENAWFVIIVWEVGMTSMQMVAQASVMWEIDSILQLQSESGVCLIRTLTWITPGFWLRCAEIVSSLVIAVRLGVLRAHYCRYKPELILKL